MLKHERDYGIVLSSRTPRCGLAVRSIEVENVAISPRIGSLNAESSTVAAIYSKQYLELVLC